MVIRIGTSVRARMKTTKTTKTTKTMTSIEIRTKTKVRMQAVVKDVVKAEERVEVRTTAGSIGAIA